ncbi:MAG: DUF192 domain-containing protein [Halobacteriales archaeon]
MEVWHHPIEGSPSRLATEVDVASSRGAKARGLMFRRSFDPGRALVFPFDDAVTRGLHMVFVFFPIDAIWTVGDEVTHCKRLRPFLGLGWARADRVIELPAGAADGVAVGDRVTVERST